MVGQRPAMTLGFLACLLLTGCDKARPFRELAEKNIRLSEELEEVLKSVVDVPTMDKAQGKLSRIGKQLEAVHEQVTALGAVSPAIEDELQPLKEKALAAHTRAMKELERIGTMPGGKDILSSLKTAAPSASMYEEIANAKIDGMGRMTGLLRDVVDDASLQRVEPKLVEVLVQLKASSARAAAMPKPGPEVESELIKLKIGMEEALKMYLEEEKRIGNLPNGHLLLQKVHDIKNRVVEGKLAR